MNTTARDRSRKPSTHPPYREAKLSEAHRRMLFDESGLRPEVVEEREARTITRLVDLPPEFKGRQRRKGLLLPLYSPDGKTTSHQLRPDKPINAGRKYEQPAGVGCILDVHPRMMRAVRDRGRDLWVTEGVKKADALTGRGLCTITLAGVWNWGRKGEMMPCWDHVALNSRRVYVVFDSDVMTKEGPQMALERLVSALEARGAKVLVVYLPEVLRCGKTGVDDYLAAGHSVNELKALARKFEPADIGTIRLSRDAKLGASIEYLWQQWHDADWMHFKGTADTGNWQRGHTARDAMAALIGLVPSVGKPDARGVIVEAGLRRISRLAAKSPTSVGYSMKHLEADGQIEILPARDEAKPRRYLLLVPSAALYSTEKGHAEGTGSAECDPRCKGLRYPSAFRLHWSSPARLGRLARHVEGATGRTVTEAVGENVFVDPDYRPYAKRLGPHRGAVLDALEAAGGEMHLKDLCEALHRKRPWDVRRRILKPLEEAGIIECDGDVVRLAAGWLTRLDERREKDGEVEQAERQRKRHIRESKDHRERLERLKDGTPAASIEAVRRSRELRERRMRGAREEEERRRAPVDPALLELVARLVKQNGRIRMELLCGIASDEGMRGQDVPRAVEALGCRVEELAEYGNEQFVFPPSKAVA